MRLRNFLIISGLWVALLPHLGFSISAENVLFSITGFILIVSSFYVAAIEDKHRHKRVIQGEALEETSQRFGSLMGAIKKTSNLKRSTTQPRKDSRESSTLKRESSHPEQQDSREDIFVVEEDDGRPRIRKAVSDVRIKAGSEDDIVS
jgi:hypothetical protein